MLSHSFQCMPRETSYEAMELLKRLVVLMYDRTSEATKVNDAGRLLFTHKSQTLENIPPTHAAHQTHLLPGIGLESRYTRAI